MVDIPKCHLQSRTQKKNGFPRTTPCLRQTQLFPVHRTCLHTFHPVQNTPRADRPLHVTTEPAFTKQLALGSFVNCQKETIFSVDSQQQKQ